MEEGLVKILINQDDRANKFCPIICVFARSYDPEECSEAQNQISIEFFYMFTKKTVMCVV